MLRVTQTNADQQTYPAEPFHGSHYLPLQNEFKAVASRWKLVLFCVLLAFATGGYVAWATPDQYLSRVQLIVDNRTINLGRQDAVFSDSSITDATIESEVEILKSEALALDVIDRLGLASDAEFVPNEPGLLQHFAAWVGLPLEFQISDVRRAALPGFSRALSVRRLGASHIIEVLFRSYDPAKSADIANEIARVYLQRQASDKVEVARTASAWLRARMQKAGPTTKVLTPAAVPTAKSGLGNTATVLGFTVFGFGFGVAAAFTAAAVDRGIRTLEAAAAALEAHCFGSLPRIRLRRSWMRDSKQIASWSNYVCHFPNSDFAHVLHHSRLGAESFYPGGTVRTIGVTSGEGRAGKSAIAVNFASVCAQAKSGRVLLIDANPYAPSLSRTLAPDAAAGLMEVLEGKAALRDVVHSHSERNVDFVPLSTRTRLTKWTGGLIWTSNMKRIFDDALTSYETVVVDLPPITPYADVRASAPFIDVFLFAIAYDTDSNKLRRSLAALESVRSRISGSILNVGVKA